MSDPTEQNPAPIGASGAPIQAESGSREVEYAPPPSGREETVGSDGGGVLGPFVFLHRSQLQLD